MQKKSLDFFFYYDLKCLPSRHIPLTPHSHTRSVGVGQGQARTAGGPSICALRNYARPQREQHGTLPPMSTLLSSKKTFYYLSYKTCRQMEDR